MHAQDLAWSPAGFPGAGLAFIHQRQRQLRGLAPKTMLTLSKGMTASAMGLLLPDAQHAVEHDGHDHDDEGRSRSRVRY